MADTNSHDRKIESGAMNQAGNTGQDGANHQARSEANRHDNETMQRERAKAEVSGERSGEGRNQEKSAIGGSSSSQATSQTGEPGRARNEVDNSTSR